jgi:membrane dipeptidase
VEIRSRRALSFGLLAALALLLVRLPARGAEPVPRSPGVVDLHVDLPYQYGFQGAAFARGSGQFPAHDLLRAGVVGVVLPLFVPARVSPSGPRLEDLEASYQRVISAIAETPPFAPPGCAEAPGRVRTWFAFEGAGPLAGRPDDLDRWAARGVRSLGLVHTRNNALASSSGNGQSDAEGLTPAGRELVLRAQALALPIDVSHASDHALRDVIELAQRAAVPVIATHSDARALANERRNLDDDSLRAIAHTGGVIGVNFHSKFLVSGRRATLRDVVREVLYLVRVAGVDHVAIGSDFEGDISPPTGLSSVRAMPRLAQRLLAAGLSRDAVERIFARNALRVLCAGSAR